MMPDSSPPGAKSEDAALLDTSILRSTAAPTTNTAMAAADESPAMRPTLAEMPLLGSSSEPVSVWQGGCCGSRWRWRLLLPSRSPCQEPARICLFNAYGFPAHWNWISFADLRDQQRQEGV